MCVFAVQNKAGRRRGTVMVMVVGVLAMLFIIGSTLLIVSRFERQTVRFSAAVKGMEAVSQGVLEPVMIAVRSEVAGSDGIPYNRAWPNVPGGDYHHGADYGDYPGYPGANLNVNPPRNGDLFLSSLEPHNVTVDGKGILFAASSLSDYVLAGGGKNIAVCLACGDPLRDADGDGVTDAVENMIVGFSDSFGGTYSMSLRVIPHGGMVWLDRMTHPALLVQVIHPRDFPGRQGVTKAGQIQLSDLDGSDLQGTNGLRFAIRNLLLGPSDENRLRRRFMLPPLLPTPGPGNDYSSVAPPLVQLLPITTGYADADDPTGWLSQPQNQWAMFHQGDEAYWAGRIAPGPPMTDANYNARTDTYDRRHLVTAVPTSDDLLRPQRDEFRRLLAGPDNDPINAADNPPFAQLPFYNILNPAGTGEPLAYGVMDYTASGQPVELVFNGNGLRTQFSLRDVLEPNGQASYRRAMQLTAYFLAMIQHTTVPGSNDASPSNLQWAEQLRTAVQWAVNAIDFADYDGHVDDDDGDTVIGSAADIPDQIGTCLTLDVDGPGGPEPPFTVCGVEKQPYITEAYVKRIRKGVDLGTGAAWYDYEDPPTNSQPCSIYAVELYNPYDVALDLDGYLLRVGSSPDINLGTLVRQLAPRSYVVVANRPDDPSVPGANPFITGAVVGTNLFISDAMVIDNASEIRLLRTNARLAELTPAGLVFPANAPAEIEIDRIAPDDVGAVVGNPVYWAIDAETLATLLGQTAPAAQANAWLVRDSSLQRHKEVAGQTPIYWHFTLSRQMLFPLPWYEHPQYPDPAQPHVDLLPTLITSGVTRPAQHNLLGTSSFTGPDSGRTNQQLTAAEFAGIAFSHPPVGNPIIPAIPGFPVVCADKSPIAPFPVLTADRGAHANTGGTLAFPTTGTLLLVTRYAQLLDDPANPGQQLPLTVAATRLPPDLDPARGGVGVRTELQQLFRLDNGHLPIFDPDQRCLDGNNSRFNNLPWGQLAFEYFTALPLEELARDLEPATAGVQRLMDLNAVNPAAYRNEYGAVGGAWNDPNSTRFLNYPLVVPVDTASLLGSRVEGRINPSVAPWWVLDGLPVLPDATLLDAYNKIPRTSNGSLAALPVPEVEAVRLDPPNTHPNFMAGAWFVHRLIDEKYLDLAHAPWPYSHPDVNVLPVTPPAGMPSISPTLAQYMVSYREQRAIGTIDASDPNLVGFATIGELCNVVRRVTMPRPIYFAGQPTPLDNPTIEEMRLAVNDYANPTERPFSYLGYLQLVTPIVRMQDWMTVKNHVFTIYAVIRSSGQPPVTVRTQVTIDRTRCLYSPADLPERITETPPISYYNAVDD